MNIKLAPDNFSTEAFQELLNNFSLDDHAEYLEQFKGNEEFKKQVGHELGQTFVTMLTIAELLDVDMEKAVHEAIGELEDECEDDSDDSKKTECKDSSCDAECNKDC